MCPSLGTGQCSRMSDVLLTSILIVQFMLEEYYGNQRLPYVRIVVARITGLNGGFEKTVGNCEINSTAITQGPQANRDDSSAARRLNNVWFCVGGSQRKTCCNVIFFLRT